MVTTLPSRGVSGDQGLGRLALAFDDERAVANAGLVLASTLAGRLGIKRVIDETLDLGARPGAARPGRKLLTLVYSALLGGDSIEDADVLRCGETERVLGQRAIAPSTLGTFLRSFTFGHVRQLDRAFETILAPSRSRSTSTRRSSKSPGTPSRAPALGTPSGGLPPDPGDARRHGRGAARAHAQGIRAALALRGSLRARSRRRARRSSPPRLVPVPVPVPEPVRLEEPIVGSVFLEELLRERLASGAVAVEIGCGLGSTPHLADLCAERGALLYAVDTSPTKLAMSREATRESAALRTVQERGEDFLRSQQGEIAFVYLDNYDWVDSATDTSGSYPSGLSKRESELVHLEQALLLLPKLCAGALVAVDNTWFVEREPPGGKRLRDQAAFARCDTETILRDYDVLGKGSLAVPYLLSLGFQVAAFVEWPVSTQVLLRGPVAGEAPPSGSYGEGYFEELLREHRLVTYPSSPRGQRIARARLEARWALLTLRGRLRLRTRLRALRRRLP